MNLKERPNGRQQLMALGCIGALTEIGKSIPGDVFVVGYDNRDIARFIMPPLTTLHLLIFDMRSKTIELIAEGAGGITSSHDPVED
jgi:LacI family transcriptional regulator